jgi:hypothetical protein
LVGIAILRNEHIRYDFIVNAFLLSLQNEYLKMFNLFIKTISNFTDMTDMTKSEDETVLLSHCTESITDILSSDVSIISETVLTNYSRIAIMLLPKHA